MMIQRPPTLNTATWRPLIPVTRISNSRLPFPWLEEDRDAGREMGVLEGVVKAHGVDTFDVAARVRRERCLVLAARLVRLRTTVYGAVARASPIGTPRPQFVC